MKKLLILMSIFTTIACSTNYKSKEKDSFSDLAIINKQIVKENCSYMNTQKILHGIPVYLSDSIVENAWGK